MVSDSVERTVSEPRKRYWPAPRTDFKHTVPTAQHIPQSTPAQGAETTHLNNPLGTEPLFEPLFRPPFEPPFEPLFELPNPGGESFRCASMEAAARPRSEHSEEVPALEKISQISDDAIPEAEPEKVHGGLGNFHPEWFTEFCNPPVIHDTKSVDFSLKLGEFVLERPEGARQTLISEMTGYGKHLMLGTPLPPNYSSDYMRGLKARYDLREQKFQEQGESPQSFWDNAKKVLGDRQLTAGELKEIHWAAKIGTARPPKNDGLSQKELKARKGIQDTFGDYQLGVDEVAKVQADRQQSAVDAKVVHFEASTAIHSIARALLIPKSGHITLTRTPNRSSRTQACLKRV